MKILYYITSHGYGHAVRTITICNNFSTTVDLVVRTTVPEEFFKQELKRPFTYAPAQFDCGCMQTDGVTVDRKKTLDLYKTIATQNRICLDGEVLWCQENGFDVIVSDIVPFAFDVAKKAGIPCVAVTNFTWHTIYNEYVAAYPDFIPYLDEIKQQYSNAALALLLFPPNDMPYFSHCENIGIVGRSGKNVRDAICMHYKIATSKKIGLIYTGTFGMDSMPWKKLSGIDNWEFLGLYPLPDPPDNYHIISKQDFLYQDLVASADVMISKLGYGTCAECFVNGLPIVYLPRSQFAEYPVLAKAVESWGNGYLLSTSDYYELNWKTVLENVEKNQRPLGIRSNAAKDCAMRIESLHPIHI